MYKSTFLFSTLLDTCEDSASRSCYQEQGDTTGRPPFLKNSIDSVSKAEISLGRMARKSG